ncbi:hypothetical protein LJK87_37575 [Paenibacillus sp. P25]|nr:hypothetical protein LJK87_37575 [Paenibacillus sp. P25]
MKILQWSLKLAVTAAVTSVCCMVLTFAAVNTYVNMLLDQYHIQRPAGQRLGWGPFLSAMTRQIGGLAAADGSGSGTAAGTGAGAGSGAGAGGGKDLAVSAGGSALTDNGTPEPKSGQTSSPGARPGRRIPARSPTRTASRRMTPWRSGAGSLPLRRAQAAALRTTRRSSCPARISPRGRNSFRARIKRKFSPCSPPVYRKRRFRRSPC